MINSKDRDFWINRIDNVGYHTPDWWLNYALERAGELQPSFKNLILTKQASGVSIIDNVYRNEKII
jgi:hypothetical protein